MLYYLLCLAPFPALVLGAQQVPLTDTASSPFTESLDKLVSQNLDRWHTPGLAVAVIDGKNTFSKVWTSLSETNGRSMEFSQTELVYASKFYFQHRVTLIGVDLFLKISAGRDSLQKSSNFQHLRKQPFSPLGFSCSS